MRRELYVVFGYLGVMAPWIYWVLDRQPSANRGEPLPIWLGLSVFSPIAVLVVAVGIGTRVIRSS